LRALAGGQSGNHGAKTVDIEAALLIGIRIAHLSVSEVADCHGGGIGVSGKHGTSIVTGSLLWFIN
jgi:hypothetical protein